LARDPRLWLSRSWTTREPRPTEPPESYTFVDRPTFLTEVERGGFLEWAEFHGSLYGTPWPAPPPGRDILLEIDLQGARQVKSRHPDAVVVLLEPPSEEVQRARLRARGDPDDQVRLRIATGRQEVAEGRVLADHVVVNDDLDHAVSQVAAIVAAAREGNSL
jgi:guanylate kinase